MIAQGGPADRREGERRDYGDDWRHDSVRMAAAIQTVARMLVEWHDQAEAAEARIRAEAKRQGHAIDTRADYSAGAAGAHGVTISALTGALRVASVDELTGPRDLWRNAGMQRPTLPSELTRDDVRQVGTVLIHDDAFHAALIDGEGDTEDV